MISKIFRFSLRTKIILITTCLLLLVVFSICYYLLNTQRQNYIKREIAFQESTSGLLADSVSSQYFNYINQQIIELLNERINLKNKTSIIEYYNNFISSLSAKDYKNLLNNQSHEINNFNLHLFVYDHDTDCYFYNDADSDLLTASGTAQANRNIQNTLKGEISPSGYFLAINHDNDYYLAYFVHNRKNNRSFALVKNIKELSDRYSKDDQILLNSVRESLNFINEHWSGQILIFKNDRVILQTDPNSNIGSQLPFEYLTRSKEQNFPTELVSLDKQYFLKVNYFKSLDWYLVSIRDADDVFEPILALTKFVIMVGLITVLIAFMLIFLFTRSITASLSNLSKKAYQIAKSDLSDPKAMDLMLSDIKATGTDEIGTLEKAIVHMGKSINDNVNSLITISSKQSRIEGELNAARDIQKGLLPANDALPQSKIISFASCLYPAKEVAGDFYDIFRVDDTHIAFVIGDVSDKGVPAALFMSTTITMMRQALSLGKTPASALTSVNKRLAERNPNMMFVTMIALTLDETTEICTICNAGHCPPIIINKNEVLELENLSGAAAGVMEDLQYSEFTYKLNKGQSLVLYTDGISEAQNEAGNFFGVEKIQQILQNTAHLSSEEILNILNNEVSIFRGNALQSDDITALCIQAI